MGKTAVRVLPVPPTDDSRALAVPIHKIAASEHRQQTKVGIVRVSYLMPMQIHPTLLVGVGSSSVTPWSRAFANALHNGILHSMLKGDLHIMSIVRVRFYEVLINAANDW